MADDDPETDDNMSINEEDENDSDFTTDHDRLTKRIKRSNGKWKLYNETKSFKKEWLDLFPWVEEHPNDPKFAICRACNKKITAQKNVLEIHQRTKQHIKNISGCDDIDDDDEVKKPPERIDIKQQPTPVITNVQTQQQPVMEQMLSDEQISFFTESHIDAAHQAVTEIVDKLVERYHDNKLDNLRFQMNEQKKMLAERTAMAQEAQQRTVELQMMREANKLELVNLQMKFRQQEHKTLIHTIENERDAKLKSVEQQLMYARQEYEKKVKLLDQQLQYIK